MNNEKILVVDDDAFMFEYVKTVLGADYEVVHAPDGASCLQIICDIRPVLTLLDVCMPNMDGYDVCRSLREDPGFDGLAIVFMSSHASAANRLAAFDAGANDFLTKPIAPKELKLKVDAIIGARQELAQLRRSAEEAFSVAMSAMTDASVFGRIINLFRAFFDAHSQREIGVLMLQALNEMSVQATVQIRGASECFTQDVTGRSSSMEDVMLRHLSATGERISEFGQRIAFVFGPVSILVRNAPTDDAERGRLRDYLAFIAEGAAERAKSLENERLEELVRHTETVLARIEADYRAQQATIDDAFRIMVQDFEGSLLHLGLSERQEDALIAIVQTAMLHAQQAQSQGIAVDRYLSDLSRRYAKP